jgi:hypothetical protein
MPRPNKEIYIDFILDELNKGNNQYKDVVSLFCEKFRLSSRTFDNYWKLANETYLKHRTVINNAKIKEGINQEKKALKSLILDKIARMKIAEEIAIGTPIKVEGSIVIPNASERLKALDYLSKIEGDYSPKEIDLTTYDNTFKLEIINANTSTPG